MVATGKGGRTDKTNTFFCGNLLFVATFLIFDLFFLSLQAQHLPLPPGLERDPVRQAGLRRGVPRGARLLPQGATTHIFKIETHLLPHMKYCFFPLQPDECLCKNGWEGSTCEDCVRYWSCPSGGTCREPNQCVCTREVAGGDQEGLCNREDINGMETCAVSLLGFPSTALPLQFLPPKLPLLCKDFTITFAKHLSRPPPLCVRPLLQPVPPHRQGLPADAREQDCKVQTVRRDQNDEKKNIPCP